MAAVDLVGLAVGGAGSVGIDVTTGVGGAVVSAIDFAALGDAAGVTVGIGVAVDEQAAATNRPTVIAANRECDMRISNPSGPCSDRTYRCARCYVRT